MTPVNLLVLLVIVAALAFVVGAATLLEPRYVPARTRIVGGVMTLAALVMFLLVAVAQYP